jgi:hypothetical protein
MSNLLTIENVLTIQEKNWQVRFSGHFIIIKGSEYFKDF